MRGPQDSGQQAARILLQPKPTMGELVIRPLDFPKQVFIYKIPEAIGGGEDPLWAWEVEEELAWKPSATGWSFSFTKPGELKYTGDVTAGDDFVRIRIRLRNLSDQAWQDSFAFSCFRPVEAPVFADFDGSRTFLLRSGAWQALTELERRDSVHPLMQLWVKRQRSLNLGFVRDIAVAPNLLADGSIAVRSWDGRHALALSSDRPLFVFSNLEFACVHCCPSFGPLAPGEAGLASHLVLFCKDTSLEGLAARLASFAW